MPSLPSSVAEDFRSFIAGRLRSNQEALSARWLGRLTDLVPVEPNEIFPTKDLLDHIPALILEIADYLEFPEREEIAANTLVMAKARDLGTLRFEQQASVHQILREYRILGGVLMAFVREEVAQWSIPPVPTELVDVMSRVSQAISVLQQGTMETFIECYAGAMERQTTQLVAFNRMVSHELRQPIGTLQFAVRLLGSTQQATEAADSGRLLSLVERNVVRLSELTDRLARLSGMQGHDALQVQRVQLSTVVNEVARQLREMADARGVSITVQDDLGEASVDLGAIELIFMNLISNAVKYSDPAKTERWVAVSGSGSLPRQHAITVSDNGLGIPAGDLPSIFNHSFRAHESRDDELGIEGLGLGLAIVKDCLQIIGGQIAVESQEGSGTSFRLTFPRNE